MSLIDSEENGRDAPNGGAAGDGPAATPAVGGPPAAPPSPARLRGLALVAGLGAGFVAWLGGEAAHGYFRPARAIVYLFGVPKPNVTPATQAVADGQNAAAAFGLLGATLGLALGSVGGRARRSARAGTRAALAGGALGGALGAATAGAMPILDLRLRDPLSLSLALPLLFHSGIAAAVGAAGGLALGLGLGGRGQAARAAMGGLLGGVLGAALYEMIGALAFPLAGTIQTIPVSWGARLLDRLLIATLVAVGAAVVAGEPRGGGGVRRPGPLLEDGTDSRTEGDVKARSKDVLRLSVAILLERIGVYRSTRTAQSEDRTPALLPPRDHLLLLMPVRGKRDSWARGHEGGPPVPPHPSPFRSLRRIMHIRLITCCGLLCGVALGSLGLASGCGGPDRPQALAPEEAQRARKKMMEAMRKGISGGMGKTKAAKSKMLRSLEKM